MVAKSEKMLDLARYNDTSARTAPDEALATVH
jgi:hypothetical protein